VVWIVTRNRKWRREGGSTRTGGSLESEQRNAGCGHGAGKKKKGITMRGGKPPFVRVGELCVERRELGKGGGPEGRKLSCAKGLDRNWTCFPKKGKQKRRSKKCIRKKERKAVGGD